MADAVMRLIDAEFNNLLTNGALYIISTESIERCNAR